jgi:hypothetical protein
MVCKLAEQLIFLRPHKLLDIMQHDFRNLKLTNMKNYFPFLKKNLFFLLLCFFYLNNQSLGQSQSYLDGLPSKNDIISKIKGHNAKETYGKQIAALEIMYDIIIFYKLEERTKLNHTDREIALLKDYNWKDLIDKYSTNVEPLETPEKKKAFQIYSRNLMSDKLEAELVNNLFSSDAKNQYEKANKPRIDERKRRDSNKTKAIISLIAGIAFLFGWVSLRLWIRKRQLNRLNEHSVKEVNTHNDLGKKNLTKEPLGWISFFVLVIGIALIIYGAYLFSLLN